MLKEFWGVGYSLALILWQIRVCTSHAGGLSVLRITPRQMKFKQGEEKQLGLITRQVRRAYTQPMTFDLWALPTDT